ncbi:FMN-dependent dehydrogenase, includes L-lactate dehydrogenase and type II isopentenyl diphosphate isomerase [Maridesulfovibrio ferrireducens]|uniref:FMN-dependent dehydrogenase, includes L-lactate dehydrogenase and type II isopentenyl diphosphate isomerase n=1 Tax=Maridesulfovibrio ferrireducens TaxID=246191 RepID=A0A1G9H6A5_9BACT|nr:alpha-hydroxy-acid oxidizing protein [Maridesulfovibrio ferrireducens]SDL08487.1 FMN-dependent dehydrogenase, includes L-lactate dehydrogenase and type II isopentenyl diphosphate isomerase [Maridesulfovibrio ferrireducens]
MKSTRDNARELMKGYCKVCPVCNGKACVGEVPGMGGLGTGSSFKNNVKALADIKLNMRTIHDFCEPDTSVNIMGLKLDIPVLAAPIGGVSFNMGGKIEEIDYISAKLKACVAKGIIGCTGDGVPDFIHQSGFTAIEEVKGHGIPFIKPWEEAELYMKLEKAEKTGAKIIGMDIDAAGLITLKKMGRPVTPKPINKLRSIIESVNADFILKGIMTPDEARMAIDAGAKGIVVSNHGGRVLDSCPGTAEVLREISKAVAGQCAIMVDGGVRTGIDVLKMLALGADAVMIGRPFSIATIGGLQDGAEKYIDQLKSEFTQAMVLTGTERADSVNFTVLYT